MENELKKCLLCKNPFCKACPVGTAIPEVIKLVRDGKTDEAGAMLFDNNPLSAITGEVCPNHLYCHGSCILSRKGKGVDFGKIEREISRQYLDKNQDSKNKKLKPKDRKRNKGKKVLIVGSGPAGLAAAYYLKKNGHQVTVYEREELIGGMLRYGIPDFRLDKTLIDKIVNVLIKFGVKFKVGCEVNLDKIDEYKKDFDLIVLAIGAGVSRKLGLKGEDSSFVTHALEYLKQGERQNAEGKSIVIIGGGNVAIDCALTAAQNNPEASVALCYRRNLEDMKAYPEELEFAREKNVKFEFQMVPKKIIPEGVVFERSGQEIIMHAEKVIVAIGQGAIDLGKMTSYKIQATSSGLIEAENFRTSIEGVYAIGDAVTGTSTIIKAVAAAKELAKVIS